MTDERSAVVTTLNGQIVEWKIFDDPQRAREHYCEGVCRLRDFLQRSSGEDAWEIMLCDVRQYALSKPQKERTVPPDNTDWYGRSLKAMANQARRIRSIRPRWNLQMWNRLRDNVRLMLHEDEESTQSL
ncbi:MAG: hypothetical protein GX307_07735 [Euryarchaeota archaeon]|nr:hypothetical protein [Euryarchaeota archaeon]